MVRGRTGRGVVDRRIDPEEGMVVEDSPAEGLGCIGPAGDTRAAVAEGSLEEGPDCRDPASLGVDLEGHNLALGVGRNLAAAEARSPAVEVRSPVVEARSPVVEDHSPAELGDKEDDLAEDMGPGGPG